MRIWNVNPEILCDKHLLGEHVETHMFVGTINKGKSIRGYINNNLVEVHNLKKRHDELEKEMLDRKMKPKSPLNFSSQGITGFVDKEENLRELYRRCKKCRSRIESIL